MLLAEIFRQLLPRTSRMVGTVAAITAGGYRVSMPDGGLLAVTGQSGLLVGTAVVVEDGVIVAVLGEGLILSDHTIF